MLTLSQIQHFENMKNRCFEDEASLKLLKSCLQSEQSNRGGTLQTYLAQMSAATNTGTLIFTLYLVIYHLSDILTARFCPLSSGLCGNQAAIAG
jgi:hypothetical protein